MPELEDGLGAPSGDELPAGQDDLETPADDSASLETQDDQQTELDPAPKPAPKGFKTWEDYWKAEYKREKKKRQELQGRSITEPAKKPAGPDPDEELLNRPDDQIKTVEELRRKIQLQLKKELGGEFSEAAKQHRLATSQDQARKTHDGSDGLPAYDDLLDETVLPLIQKNPAVYQLIREMPDPAEAAYTLGIIIKFPKLYDLMKEQGRTDLVDNIQKAEKKAVSVRGRKETLPSKKQTAAEIMAMKPEDVEREIAKVTGRPF